MYPSACVTVFLTDARPSLALGMGFEQWIRVRKEEAWQLSVRVRSVLRVTYIQHSVLYLFYLEASDLTGRFLAQAEHSGTVVR